jgi:predicted alpha/beta superfamily hydrolase
MHISLQPWKSGNHQKGIRIGILALSNPKSKNYSYPILYLHIVAHGNEFEAEATDRL